MEPFFPRDAGSMDCIRILCHDWLLPLISESKLLHIRHDPVGFLKSDGPMKPLAVRFVQFAVAVEFRTVFGFCPVFARGQQFAGDALPTRAFPDVDSLPDTPPGWFPCPLHSHGGAGTGQSPRLHPAPCTERPPRPPSSLPMDDPAAAHRRVQRHPRRRR